MKVDMEETLTTANDTLATDIIVSSRKNVNRYFIAFAILILLSIGFYFIYPYIHIDVIRQTLTDIN